MSLRASVFLGSLGGSLLLASTALAQTTGGGGTVGGGATVGAGATTGGAATADGAAGVEAPDNDPGHRFLIDLHVGGLAELDADEETESYGGALIGGNFFYGPLTWLSLGVGYERSFLGRDDETLSVDETRRTSRGANAIWLTGRLYPYENEDFALFLDIAGAPVWQDISVSRTDTSDDAVTAGSSLGSTCSASDSAAPAVRGGLGVEFPLQSLLIMHAQAGVDHYGFDSDLIDGCGTAGNPATFFAGRIGFAISTGRQRKVGDADGDQILDDVDACPTVKGVPSNDKTKHGCPIGDRDRDTILDPNDACPDIPGAAQADPAKNGCPLPGDQDGDGIIDEQDACRTVPGVANPDPTRNGCPADKDNDGILDAADACPDVPGVANADPTKNGCPAVVDQDGDGILDAIDACPTQPGKADPDPTKHGCPLVTVTDKEIVIREQVQFETNKAIIRPESNGLLDSVANAIKSTPQIKKLEVQGHTDNTGAKAHNQQLSQRRAEAVKAALVTRGVDAAKMTTKGYGQDQPIGDNTTDAGKTKNRRVQFVILEKDGATGGGATPAAASPAAAAPPAAPAPKPATPPPAAPAPKPATPPPAPPAPKP